MKLIRKPPLKPKEEAEVLLTIGYRQTFKSTFISMHQLTLEELNIMTAKAGDLIWCGDFNAHN